MVVASVFSESQLITSSPSTSTSKRESDACSETDQLEFESPPLVQRKESDVQSPASLKSEEYRQLFRLQWDEVLVQDFNCAFQESILLQGHMYLFVHSICFYSNIFGFETKKLIPFDDVTSVRKAKTAAIFPNAIEISTGEKKHFFASFLSRDEAYRQIVDGWESHLGNGSGGHIYREDAKAELQSQEGGSVVVQRVNIISQSSIDAGSVDRNGDVRISGDFKLLPDCDADTSVTTRVLGTEENREEEAELVVTAECLSFSVDSLMWVVEDVEAPKVAAHYTKVAESKFQVSYEEFFKLFCSDDALNFVETFHEISGDKEFRCSSWCKNEQFGYSRELSFLHPIKIYFGAKCSGCKEVQKFRVYKNSQFIIETIQEVSDVPYGDYFHVEGLWVVDNDGDETNKSCMLRVYTHVAFCKKTIWKGKIEQSTVEECRGAYELWLDHAHSLLKQKNFSEVDVASPADILQNDEAVLEGHDQSIAFPETLHKIEPKKLNPQLESSSESGSRNGTSTVQKLRESLMRFCLYVKNQNHFPLILFMASVSILLLMQLTIIVLLTRAPEVHLVSQLEHINGRNNARGRAEDVAWLEKRVHHLKDEMFIVEARLEKMKQEYILLKSYLKGLEVLK